ncbi:hypothetical protein ILUMI_03501 [Ignelater luminosus]|uniref:Tetratricopeptide repeat protein 25 n=1 Tax=Ignelater luminosus TaxID=2038154 RepID=A0A8K0DFP6_IGNLU|nr:hypothetical protein ILUMI_03501 [Ignelater luminosus]
MAYSQKEDEVYGAQTFYRELAYFIARREEYERALNYFDEAIKKSPTDKRALMGRCWARSKVCKYQGALEDIAKALGQDPKDLVAIAHKALNTYLCCEFEDALILNLRMVPKRKKPDNFTMGVMHCNEAIENCVGVRAGHPLRDHFKIVRRLAWKKSRESEKPFEPKSRRKRKKKKKKKKRKAVQEPVVPLIKSKISRGGKSMRSMHSKHTSNLSGTSRPTGEEIELKTQDLDQKSAYSAISEVTEALGIDAQDLTINDSLNTLKTESDYVPPYGRPFPYRPLQRYTTNIENYMAEKYLDSMYLDKIFLKNLKSHLGVPSPNKIGSKKIIHMSKEGYKTLSYKQELLRTRRPFYFIKYQEAKLSGALKARMDAELRKMQNAASKDADNLLYKIRKALNEKETRTALETAEKLKIFCDSKPKKVLPKREDYLDHMYKLVSRAYYQLFRLNKKQFEWDQVKRIYNWLGLPRSREPSTDSVINQFKGVFIDWKKQIAVFEERLRKATTSEEMAWLYHELARYHTEVKQYELARVYARKCISEGREANNIYWIVDAMMMIFRINMLQHNRNDAKYELNEVLMVAKQIEDRTLLDYIEKCLELIDKVGYDDAYGAKVLEKRERQIIQMMAGVGMKDEVAYLFRKMGAMPATRRMSVMPGVRLDDTAAKATAATRKMSIMPGAKQAEDQQPVKHVSVASKKGEGEPTTTKGIAFMELIKYHVD